MITTRIGDWFVAKYRKLASEVGTFQAARNLRKQGVPLEVALLILVPRKGA